MKLNSRDLKTIVHRTLEHYDQRRRVLQARDYDASQNIAASKVIVSVTSRPPSPTLNFHAAIGRQSWVK